MWDRRFTYSGFQKNGFGEKSACAEISIRAGSAG
jgi:hypothetical protein